VRNTGGASRGLSIELSGSALSLVDLESAQIVVGPPKEGNFTTSPIARGVGEFPNAEIPAGIAGGFSGFVRGMDPRKMVDAMYASNVHVNIFGRGTAIGEGDLVVTFVTGGARFSQTVHMKVRAASRKPLRARTNVEAHSLEPLDGRGVLVAMASMKLDQPAAAEIASRVLARIGSKLDGGASVAIFPIRARDRPRTLKKIDARAIGAAMKTEALVTIETQRATFAFGGPIIRRPIKGDRELPTIAFAFEAVRDQGEALSVMQEIMTEHRGVQAMVVRWGKRPPVTLDTTPYEIACGVHGQCTLYESWQTRWLRSVGVGTLFLGDELRARANVPARIDVADGELDAIEAKLAPILPSEEDWRSAVAKMYGR
jgi:hypothetical protein